MLQRAVSLVRGFFVTKTVVPPPPAPVPAPVVPAAVLVPLTEVEQGVRLYLEMGFEVTGETPDGGVIMRTPDDRVQVSLHPDGRQTTSYRALERVH